MGVYRQNFGVAIIVISLKSCLASCEGIGGNPNSMQRHAHQGNGLSLSSGDQHVHLTPWGLIIDLIGDSEKLVCLLAHGTDN